MKALVAAAAIALATPALSQKPEPALPPEVPLAAADRDQLIDATLAALEKSYVFPEVATKMTEAIRARQEAGEYAAIDGSRQFARILTEHLQAVSRAHPGGVRQVHGEFRLFVTTGRAISPVTRTNWEGTGVAPDVETAADEALERAKALALEALGRA